MVPPSAFKPDYAQLYTLDADAGFDERLQRLIAGVLTPFFCTLFHTHACSIHTVLLFLYLCVHFPSSAASSAKAAADKDDVDLAVKAAKTCLYSDNWGYKSTGKQRAVILRKLSSSYSPLSFVYYSLFHKHSHCSD